MVLLTTTPEILSAISLLPSDNPLRSSTAADESPLPTSLETPISHLTLIRLSHVLRSLPKSSSSSSPEPTTTRPTTTYTLNTLLHATRPYHPPTPPPPPPSASYLALKARLLAAQEQRDYDALVSSNRNKPPSILSSSDDDEADPISPSLILNILLSILLCAFSVFYATRYWPNDGVRVLLSLAAGVVVGVAEVGVYAAYLRKVRESRLREGRRREKKFVMGRKGPEVEGERVDGEKEEIWGRGVNGGVRRRVRENWQKGRKVEEEETEKKT